MIPLPLYLMLTYVIALSVRALYLCIQNITRLRTYEEQSEKAAEWSQSAAERLHKTRSTQISGTVAILLSDITSSTILIRFTIYTEYDHFVSAAAIVNAVACFVAKEHMGRFWNDRNQTRVPFVEKWNEAVRGSEAIAGLLGGLFFMWGAFLFVAVFGIGNTWLGWIIWVGSVTGVASRLP